MSENLFKELIEQHKEVITALIECGLFSMSNGSITIHYDNNGVVRKIEQKQIRLTGR